MTLRHLVLVHQRGAQDVRDLVEIGGLVETIASDIRVFVADNELPSSVTRRKAASEPTLVVSFGPLARFRPERGRVIAGGPIPKIVEMKRLRDAGVAIPRFEELVAGTVLNPEEWGPIVILKPGDQFASLGIGMALRRTEAVHYDPPDSYPESHPARRAPMIVQRFIRTGPTVRHMRVITLFGAPLLAMREVSEIPAPPDWLPDDFLQCLQVRASRGSRQRTLLHEDDVIAFARQAAAVFSEIPLQACDIVRDEKTGALYALEVNPGGNTWPFSNRWSATMREELGIDDLRRPFEAWQRAAECLIAKTRAEAA